MELIFEKSKPGRKGYSLPPSDVPVHVDLPADLCRKKEAPLPSLTEQQVVRHFTLLSRQNFGVDSHFYPLGSCTMKYNPKFTEALAAMPAFKSLHPLLPQLPHGNNLCQGSLILLHELEQALSRISGMDAFTLQPLAGAHGELTGVMVIAAYHKKHGNHKKYILIPDSGHGTNPATAAIAGYQVKAIPSGPDGCMDLGTFKKELRDDVAAVMLTSPNTLGVFNPRIHEIADLTHKAGGLMYYDGANLNAIMGKTRPGDLGFDVVHLNLHKTFATPHGGGGPGAGPVGVKKDLAPFLPVSRIVQQEDGTYALHYDEPDSIGYIAPFYGNFLILLRAYAYILRLGSEGLTAVSENAVLSANYLLARLKEYYEPGCDYSSYCMHEFVLSAKKQKENGVTALDLAKGLIERGVHPPTVYFPLIIKEALMIEPTETETLETLDYFIEVMIEFAQKAEEDPGWFHTQPESGTVSRLDEVRAARDMDLCSIPAEKE